MKKLLLTFSLIALNSTINAQWTSQGTGFAAASRGLNQISIVDATTVWALAYDGAPIDASHPTTLNIQEFTRTTDGGTSWATGTIDVGNTVWELNNISPVSATTAWVSAINNITGDPENGVGYIYKTTDGGSTWNQQLASGFQTAGSSFLNGVYFFNANVGIAYGDPIGSGLGEFEIYRTTDGGANWTQLTAAALPNPLNGEYGYNSTPTAVGNTLWFPTNKGRLYRTNDAGVTWTVAQAPLTDFGAALPANSGNVHFSDINNGYLLKTSGTVATPVYTYYTTTNGGTTWTPTSGSPFTGTRQILNYIPGTTTIVATSQAAPVGTSVSANNGVTWTDLEPAGTEQRGTSAFLNATTGWCAGFSDGDPLGSAGIFKLSGTLGVDNSGTVAKFKVYPNPATSVVTISTPDVDTANLSVTDLSGKVVMTKSLNGIENTIDISTLSTGAYFFELSSNNKKEVVKILKN
ncbi:T9SS type A sorting domain-containing protein [Flavobacterium paronense]|uniref:T9SS type A sorting domain-containing protein n=1 Tax=Flavobacterium paronense TaxID=1392775 RepID=A0ABV5GER4_9FLAO|nr:T9SS type A sorting domain-containing protein [Flavobacterium paronense]MDN3678420.1 T9SS type A sorting domain-containing protein [Flavobacterium paronense]